MAMQRNKIQTKEVKERIAKKKFEETPEEAARTPAQLATARKERTASGIALGEQRRQQLETLKAGGAGLHEAGQILAAQIEKSPEGAMRRKQLMEPLLAQIGQVPEAPPANIQVAGLGEVLPELGIKAGAAAGGAAGAAGIGALAGAGAVAATGIGAVALAAGVAVTANSIVSSLKEERLQQVKTERTGIINSFSNLRAIILEAKTGDSLQAVEMYNREIGIIWQAESNLKLLDESKWTKAKDDLREIEDFRRNKWRYDLMLENALIQNPNTIFEFPNTGLGKEETA